MNSEEREFLVALQAHPHAVHRHHAVDREVASDIAQHLDVVELGQPLGVVDHGGGIAAAAEGEEPREGLLDPDLVLLDLLQGEDLPRLVTTGRVADAGRAAAHQCDRRAARLLQPVQHHD